MALLRQFTRRNNPFSNRWFNVDLKDVNDPVFSSGAMGQANRSKNLAKGVGIYLADAEVTIAFATGHAYGLKTTNGAEILIHNDTVSMNGDGRIKKLLAA